MEITKSSRHSKITGDFCENLVLYLLSKYGFECARVDHTGIDIIATNPKTKEVMGISVKGRSKTEKAIGSYIGIPNDNFEKVEQACKAFNLVPYFAIVSDEQDKMHVFMLSMEHLFNIFPKGDSLIAWKMTEPHLEKYSKDPKIMSFQTDHKLINWWND
jgi:hypothetical protein